MTRGLRNNNPGNIIKGGRPYVGEVVPSSDTRFRQFATMPYGYRALMHLLRRYKTAYGCGTIRTMINRWAPPIENNTSSYVNTVSNRTGIHADAEIDVFDKETMLKMAEAISFVENGKAGLTADIEEGWRLLCGNQ